MNAWERLARLVAIPSVSGAEGEAAAWLETCAQADGLDAWRDGVGNVRIRRQGDGHLLLLGHIDTVAGDVPFQHDEERIDGRGAVDAKGPLMAAYEALRTYDGPHGLHLIACVGEEADSRGAKALQGSDVVRDATACINLEPSGSTAVTVGYRGILRGALTVRAPCVHGAHPEPNAIDLFVQRWHATVQGLAAQDVMCRVDHIASRSDGLHDTVEARVQFRLPGGVAPASVTDRLDWGTWREHEAWPAVEAGNNGVVSAFLAAWRERGIAGRRVRKSGTSDWNVLEADLVNIPCVAYGPGDPSLDHTPDEHILRGEFEQAVTVLRDVLQRL